MAPNTKTCQALALISTEYPVLFFPVINPWEPEDREGAIAVVRTVFDEYGFTWEPEGYHRDLYDIPGVYLAPGNAFWVARLDRKVVGTVGLQFFETVPGPEGQIVEMEGAKRIAGSDCSLERLYLDAAQRGRGIGFALMRTALEAAKLHGCRRMEIWSDKMFSQAHALYLQMGAQIVGDRVSDDPDQSEEWGLTLPLSITPSR